MADLRGRCENVEYCSVASTQRVVTLPEGSNFVCPKCGEPLQSTSARRSGGLNRFGLVVQLGIVLAGAGGVAYKMTEGSSMDIGAYLHGFFPSASSTQGQVAQSQAAQNQVAQGQAPDIQASPQPAALQAPAASSALPAAVQAAPPRPAPIALALQQPAAVPQQVAARIMPAAVEAPASSTAMLFRLAGSDVVGSVLGRRLASGYLALIGDNSITSSYGAGSMVEIAGLQAGQREAVGLTFGPSGSSFLALLRGSADFAMSVSKISPAEVERLASLGDMTSPASEHVIAIQGIAAVVSPGNRVPSLTLPQLRGILSGRIVDWSEVGETPGPIHVYVVDNKGGTADTPHDQLLTQDGVAAAVKAVATEQLLAAAVAADRSAIGFAGFGNTGSARVVPLAETGGVPITPTDLTISTESYPLTRRLYLYNAANSSNGFVRRFLDYIYSPGGQAAVDAAGFVPLTVRSEAAQVPEAASERFRTLVAGATRVSIDFRFQPGSKDLDNRGLRDLERLATFVKGQRVNSSRMILVGFADNSGTPTANQIVSQKRIDSVAAALSRSGIPPGKVATFGAELPIGDNATPEGRERNRRVEVYIAPQ